MAKELNHRAEELTQKGWSHPDVTRYIELWDYRQRWGAINLEREDRLFLKKAESALPLIKTGKPSLKKPISEKSYYKRILSFLEVMNNAESKLSLPNGSRGLWAILLEEELRTIEYFKPVLGLPDTLKSKQLIPFREDIISSAKGNYKDDIENSSFDFSSLLSSANTSLEKNWKPLRDSSFDNDHDYPILNIQKVSSFRKELRSEVILKIKSTFPSLSDTDMPDPSDDWIPESNS